jgi:hypothetical protein
MQDNAPVQTGSTMISTFSFAAGTLNFIQAFERNSAISLTGEQTVTFTAAGTSAGFNWGLSGLACATSAVSGVNNQVITFTPTNPTSVQPFAAFVLTPNQAITGFTVRVLQNNPSGENNSTQFKVDVIPEPTTVASLAAVGIAFTMFRFRRRQSLN